MGIWDKFGFDTKQGNQAENAPNATSVRVEEYLQDILPEAKKGEASALEELRSFSSEASMAKYTEQWRSFALSPGSNKKTFPEWLSDKREGLIQKLGSSEEFHAITQHVHDAFYEAGKKPEEAIKLLEQKAAALNEQVNALVSQGVTGSQVDKLRMQSKRLYAAVNKIDDFIQNT
ncbi:MAG: hypothetical protein WC866_03970 [Patescibacteria group bacterium]|jgi:hypothetical protein